MIAIDVCRRCTRATAILVAAVLLHTSLPFDALGLDPVEIVHSGATPSGGRMTVHATEIWRVGGENDEHLFGAIARAISDSVGNVYLLDSQLSQTEVFTPTGEFLRTLGREGEGPGEVRGPLDICWLPNGSLGFIQAFPGKVVEVNLDGTPGGDQADRGGFGVLVRALMRSGVLILGGIRITYSDEGTGSDTRFLSRFDDRGNEQHCYVSQAATVDYRNFELSEKGQDFAWERCALGPEGNFYVAPERNQYRIGVHNRTGTLLKVIEREYTSLKRQQHQRDIARRQLEAYARHFPTPPRKITIEECEPDILSLRVADDGGLWVRTSRGDNLSGEGILTTFDVFDREGRFFNQIALACPGNPERDQLFFIGEDRLIVVAGGVGAVLSQQGVSPPEAHAQNESDGLEVRCYQLGIPGQ